jgi:hypothetical protein
METIDETNDEIRARVNAEMPRPAGGFETSEAEDAWRDAHEKRFKELCAESANAERIPKTNDTKHTPGPWDACGCTIYSGEKRIGQTWDAEDDGLPAPEMEANARLIAAAPELLEAFEGMVADWERVHGMIPQDHEARAAIAKARGGGL